MALYCRGVDGTLRRGRVGAASRRAVGCYFVQAGTAPGCRNDSTSLSLSHHKYVLDAAASAHLREFLSHGPRKLPREARGQASPLSVARTTNDVVCTQCSAAHEYIY